MAKIVVELSDEEYRELERLAKERGYSLVARFVKEVILETIKGERVEAAPDLERLYSRLERRVQDLINPFTAKVDEVLRRTAELHSRVEELEQRMTGLEERLKEEKPRAPRRGRRKSATERLREQGAVFEEDVQWLRNRDAFFDKLRREGALILETQTGRVAVDPEFWRRFVSRLSRIRSKSEDEILGKGMLSAQEYRLFNKLKSSGLIYYEEDKKRWAVVEDLTSGQ